MKLVFEAVFLALYLAVGADSVSISVSNETVTLSGTADVQLHVPIEEIWDSLSDALRARYPTINSGDTIALRWAHSSGSRSTYWLVCNTSSCCWDTCQGTHITSKGWSSCSSNMMYVITAKGKQDGEPINSGDTVSLSSKGFFSDTSYRLYCGASYSSVCVTDSVNSSMTGSNWLTYSYASFEIYSKNADYGTPVQYGDVVGLKYPYSSNNAWLSSYDDGGSFSPRNCSSSSKTPCAAENTSTGFKIFKKL